MIADIITEDPRWNAAGVEMLAERAFAAALDHLQLAGDFEVSVLACSDDRMAALNRVFRGKEQPTNVLSWPSVDRHPPTPGDLPAPPENSALGDIAIAWETCVAEADAAGKSLADHATHLFIHGFLHLLGYDHETEADAGLMEAVEVAILGKMGLSDPYT